MSHIADDAVELRQVGNRALARRDYAAAEAAFRKWVQQYPDSPEGYLALARLFERTHRHRETVELLAPQSAHFDLPAIHRSLADAYRILAARGDRSAIERAIIHYDALHQKRKDPVTLFYQGELLAEKGDLERAFEALRSSLILDPKSPTVRAAARRCAQRLGRPELAELLASE